MDHDKLNQLLQLVEGTSISEIEYAEGEWKVKLTRGLIDGALTSQPNAQPSAFTDSAQVATTASSVEPASSARSHVMTAGMTGTFYRAPAPDQAPFVSIGDVVQEGQTIAVVEAMKLLNAIEADCSGRLTEVFAEDGTTVTPDTKLFAIEPLGAADV